MNVIPKEKIKEGVMPIAINITRIIVGKVMFVVGVLIIYATVRNTTNAFFSAVAKRLRYLVTKKLLVAGDRRQIVV